MNVHITYKAAKAPDVEKEFNQQIQKLGRRLHVFRPELVHVKGIVEHNSPREGFVVSVNLRLPSGQFAARETAPAVEAAVKGAFQDIIEQLNRHKELLRNEHRRRRSRGRRNKSDAQVPFETTLAAVKPELVTGSDVTQYVNANMVPLTRFVERAIAYRESIGELRPGQVSREEVVDDAILAALGDGEEKPEKISLERWLFRLALHAIDHVARENGDAGLGQAFPLEHQARDWNVVASDEPRMQFFQPDESLTAENIIPDPSVTDPEQQFATDEAVAEIDLALRGSAPDDRDAFVLHVIEGFTVEEIATITDRKSEEVRASVVKARTQLQQKLPANNWLRSRLLKTA